jgi:hypothetical protein
MRLPTIYENGNQAWYRNDILHRNGGPAIIQQNSIQYWYINRQRPCHCIL